MPSTKIFFGFSDIQCLLDALSVHKYLQSDCQKMLQQRVEMFKNAEEVSVIVIILFL